MNLSVLPRVPTGPERRHRRKRGARAVADHPEGKPFSVNIRVQGVTYNLGYAATKEEGHAMFFEAYKWVYGEDPWRPESVRRSVPQAAPDPQGPLQSK